MSKSVATESNEGHKSHKLIGKRGAEDEGDKDEEGNIDGAAADNSTTLTPTVPATTHQFMHTPEFRRHFVEFVPVDALMALRLATKAWKAMVEEVIDEGVVSGAMLVHDGKDISSKDVRHRLERLKLVTRVVFLLNITKVGSRACVFAVNLVVVDIPEGIESIGESAFSCCESLTTVSFPTTLTLIGLRAFEGCSSLDNVNLLHTNLQRLGDAVFQICSELKSMTIPDSLQTLGENVFIFCSKLAPSIDCRNNDAVIAYFRSQQLLSSIPPAPPTSDFMATVDFKRLLIGFIQDETLMALRCASKAWKVAAEEVINQGVTSGAMMVHDGKNISKKAARALEERRKQVTRVIFLLNVTNIGNRACLFAFDLVVVDIPEGVESIGYAAFTSCSSLTTVSFPTTLKSIGQQAFYKCSSLENVDLLHTNLQELDVRAFAECSELKSMTIPDSLQTLDQWVFLCCFKLAPSNIDKTDNDAVVAYLRAQ
ncbi:hypothetical protein TrLO_g8361 [Triparma laevis f. longispina]|uniref:Leucine-rich repeat domain, L domain-like n=1 Tax=Triparma laevis f. longispina TaxID=1714387 RepID=A0A9W6ZFN3_9STRA|nr:hypothetical protein TrLO_g8361 [Triparma laevis f. longispina]